MWVSLGKRRFYTMSRMPPCSISEYEDAPRRFEQGYKASMIHADAKPTRLLEGAVPDQSHLFRGEG
jgi:hypothetical protein